MSEKNNNKIDLSNMTYEKLVSLLKENGGKIVLETKKGPHEIKLGKDGKTIDLGDVENLIEENKSLEVTEDDLKDFEDFDVYEEVNIFDDDDDSGEKGEEKPSSYSAMFNKDTKLKDIKSGVIKLDVTSIYKNKDGLEQGELKTIEFNISDGWLKDENKNFVDMYGNVLGPGAGKPPKGAIEARRHPAIISAFSRPEHGLGPENIPGIDESGFETFKKDLADGFKESLNSVKRAEGFWNTTGAILYNPIARPIKYTVRKGVNLIGKGINYIGNIKVENGTKTLGQKISESKFGKGFKKYAGLPLKKAYKNVFDNKNSETLTGTVDSSIEGIFNIVGGTASRIAGSEEKDPENIGIDKKKIHYLVEANENNEIEKITKGKISLNVQSYYKDIDSKQVLALKPEKIDFDIKSGWLKKEIENGKLVYCDINGNEVDEKNRVEACREPHVIDIFCRPGNGLGPENIPKPEGEFFLKTFGKDILHGLKDSVNDFVNAEGFLNKLDSLIHTIQVRPNKFLVRTVVNMVGGVLNYIDKKTAWGQKLATTEFGKAFKKYLIDSDFGQGVKAGYKAIFDNPRNNSITGTLKAVAFSFVGRPVRYFYRKLVKPIIPNGHDEDKNKLGNDKKNRPKHEIKLIKKPKEMENGDMKIVVRVSELKRDNLTGERVKSGFTDRVLSISKTDGFLRNAKGELCDFKGDKVDKGIEACRDSHILKAFTMSGNGIGPENIPKYVDNNNLYVLKDVLDGAKGLGRQVKEAKMFGKRIPVIGHIYNTLAITWRVPLKISKYAVRGIVNAGHEIAKKSGLLSSETIKEFAKTDFAKGMKANYKNIFDNYQKDTTWETTKAVAFSFIGRPVRYGWRMLKTPVKQEFKNSYQQFKKADGFWRKTNVVLGYPIKFIVKCPIKIGVKAVGKVFSGIGWVAKGIDSLTGKKLGGFFEEKIVNTVFGRAMKSFGKGVKNSYEAVIDTPENDTLTGTLSSIGKDIFYKPVKSSIEVYKDGKNQKTNDNHDNKAKNEANDEKENMINNSKDETQKDNEQKEGKKEGKIELGDSRSAENIEKEVNKFLNGVDLNKITNYSINLMDAKNSIALGTEFTRLKDEDKKEKIISNLSQGFAVNFETEDKKFDLKIPDIKSDQKFNLEYKITNKELQTIDSKSNDEKSLIEKVKEGKKISNTMANNNVGQGKDRENKKKEEQDKQGYDS